MRTIHVKQLEDNTWEYCVPDTSAKYLKLLASKGSDITRIRHYFKAEDTVVDMTIRDDYILTDRQYYLLLDVYHELNMVFHTSPDYVKIAFFARLYRK